MPFPCVAISWHLGNNITLGQQVCEGIPNMSDLLTELILILFAILIIYPATRALWQWWQTWYRRHARRDHMLPPR